MTERCSTDGIIVVTGASRGIGATIASELARRGFKVACLSRQGALPELMPSDAGLASRLTPFCCDITSEPKIRDCFSQIAELGSGIAGLVNNAGIHLEGPSADFSTADFHRVMMTNATATFIASREAHRYLAASRGMIVNIGSFFDKLGVKRNLAYCASKAAVGAITRCLAVEWAADHIRVINVAPGYIRTDLNRELLTDGPLNAYLKRRIPTGGASDPDNVAKLVSALFAEQITFLTGETIYIDGAQGIAH